MMSSPRAKDQIVSIRETLIKKDRELAVRALAEYLHYEIEPGVPPGCRGPETLPVMLFASEGSVKNFIEKHGLQASALEWVFEDLMYDRYVERSNDEIYLTTNGVNRFCKD